MTSLKKTLHVVDDEQNIGHLVADVATDSGFVTKVFTHSNDLQQSYDSKVDVIILDLFMPDCDGVELIRYLAQLKHDGAIILMSGGDGVSSTQPDS